MRIAFLGTRGVPARYGGFETAAEEIGRRLVARGHEVLVYCRNGNSAGLDHYCGMELVHLPAVRLKQAETLSHTALSVADLRRRACDAAILFNAANAPLLPLMKRQGIPVAVHVDGLEWKRAKWGGAGRHYYQRCERLAVRSADDLIADARGIQDYYRQRYGVRTTFIPYGAPILRELGCEKLREVDLAPDRFHLVVARFEPENNIHTIVEGFSSTEARLPLVVVGSAPYADGYGQVVREAAVNRDVRFIGSVWDQGLLDQLYGNCALYLHGHSVGGTNPSLLRAMGAAAPVSAIDVVFNREVLGPTGTFFEDTDGVAHLVNQTELDLSAARARGLAAQRRAEELYNWDEVASGYEELCDRLAGRVVARVEAVARLPVGVTVS